MHTHSHTFILSQVLFHFPEDSVDRPHEKAKAALLAAEALYPRIDRRLIGQVYLHYGHREWAAEQFELAVVVELSSTNFWLFCFVSDSPS